MKKTGFKKVGLLMLLIGIIPFFGESGFSSRAPKMIESASPEPQTIKKPEEDYISKFLSRNTEPLGLKENTALEKILNQPDITWACRAIERSILN